MGRPVAGTAVRNITPESTQFLYGYPHVERYSTGVHDPLQSCALYLESNGQRCILSANDIISFDKPLISRIKSGISDQTGISGDNIAIGATHTHSGPRTVLHASAEDDSVVPPPDKVYVDFLVEQVVAAAVAASKNPQPVSVEFGSSYAEGIGTNRRDPDGPSDLSVPVILFRRGDGRPAACVCVYSMHPTVLHEDSTLISSDFPGMARAYLMREVFKSNVPVLMFMGAAGNQSPRHVTRENTFEEATRIGNILGAAVARALSHAVVVKDPVLDVRSGLLDLPPKQLPALSAAERRQKQTAARLESLRVRDATPQEIRTAECDWFGAEEIVTLVKLHEVGRLRQSYDAILPADLIAIGIGNYYLVGWPCEIFVEYQLRLKQEVSNVFPICLTNGELHGYLVTPEAAEEGGYEASNSLFGPEAAEELYQSTLRLLEKRL